jgi:hypothetical protein
MATATQQAAVYPSAELPAIPAFAFAVPNGWTVEASPDALAVARTAEAVNGQWISALVTADRVPPQLKLADAAAISLSRIKERAKDVEVMTERSADFDGRATYVRGLSFTGSDGQKVGQLHALFFAPAADGDKVRHLFQIIGTCPASTMDDHGPRFLEVIRSFRFA